MTKKNQEILDTIVHGDVLEALGRIDVDSIDLVLTDPPYFLDRMDNNWDHKKVAKTGDYCHVVRSLPPGMKFSREQGIRFYEWYGEVSRAIHRVLKPGGFFFSFSMPRLYHRMVSAIDDAGFQIRDCFIWIHPQNQPKAMSLNHFVEREHWSANKKTEVKKMLDGWKTPQLKSCFEPIVMAQKESEGTLLENMLKYSVGLLNTRITTESGMFPSNVVTTERESEEIDRLFLLSKPGREEKGNYNTHKTVKPLAICEYIVKLATYSGDAVVLDPFVGSGTTAVAAKRIGRHYIGIDANEEYVRIAERRLREADVSAEGVSRKRVAGRRVSRKKDANTQALPFAEREQGGKSDFQEYMDELQRLRTKDAGA